MNQDGAGQVTVRLGNWKDPVLKPWAAEQMRISNEEVLSGKRGLPFSAQARCYPGGVPGQLLYPAEPFYFIQTPKVVYMIWQRDHMVRRIYMTDKHSENVKPSWFGESIGHYENGDTLVVDTIGLQTKKQLHRQFPHAAHREAARRGALQACGRRQDAGGPGQGRGPRHVQRAAAHGAALAQGAELRWSRRSAPRTTRITSDTICFRCRGPRSPISDRATQRKYAARHAATLISQPQKNRAGSKPARSLSQHLSDQVFAYLPPVCAAYSPLPPLA